MEKEFCSKVTRMDKMVLMVQMVLLTMMLMLQLATAALLVKFGCADQCGEIRIPYRFGTKRECYKDEWFRIECNQTARPPTAFISSIKLEVVNIPVERGSVTIKIPTAYFNCTSRKDSATLNLSRTPFFFSIWNMFSVVGCNSTKASMTKDIISCLSTFLVRTNF